MNKWFAWLINDLAALSLGMILTTAFAPFEIFPFAFLAPAGLLLLWLNASKRRAFWLGYLFGIGFFGTGVSWVFISIHRFGDVPLGLSILITGGFIAFLSLYPAFSGYLLNRFFPKTTIPKMICAFPAIWVIGEWARTWLFTGFPWLLLGYSQTHSPLKGYAPLFSVFGVSLTLLLTSGCLIAAWLKFKEKKYQPAYYCLYAIASIWVLGALLALIPWTKPDGKPITVSLVQGNIPQELKWTPENLALSLNRYESLTEPLWGKSEIIIWPEGAIPLAKQDATDFLTYLDKKAKASHSLLILGIPIKAQNDKYFNAIITRGNEHLTYKKLHLVPFGEYTPASPIFSRLFYFLHIPMSDLIPGSFQQLPFYFDKIKILPAICYEIAFPELMNRDDHRFNVLLTITNDAWFGDSFAQAQHLQMGQMRAIELKRPVLFVSNNGFTAIINEDGKVLSAAPQLKTAVLTGSVQPQMGLTPWMRNKMDPILFVILCLFIAAYRANIIKGKSSEDSTFLSTMNNNIP